MFLQLGNHGRVSFRTGNYIILYGQILVVSGNFVGTVPN